jgi:bifunctional non-homologous end joining protein LigD
MALTAYNKKRNFKQTSEPIGNKSPGSSDLQFVVQKHAASHLHYDFRLEMKGVLKSWAVPKGPSMNPADKRLAMMVEDHPYSYKDFEGNIPAGNYGAGNVIVWDNGVYHIAGNSNENEEKQLLAGLKKGHISFILSGKKLKGEFSLVKLHSKEPNAWLLIKKDDRYATSTDILKKNKSVISRVTLESMAERNKEKAAKTENNVIKKTKKKAQLLKPMLAKIGDKPFDNKDWVFETKYDGYRALALCNGHGEVKLYSRNLLSYNEKFPAVIKELERLKHPCLLDGEVVVEDKLGRPGFQLLQNYLTNGTGNLKYYVFDLLQLMNEVTRGLELTKRKELLKLLLGKTKLKCIFYSSHVKEYGIKFYSKALKKNWEGIIAKRANSLYLTNTRSSDWLKIKIAKQQEAIIAGFTAPQGTRKYFGAILLAAIKDGRLKYIGHCGTGFNEETLKNLYEKFKPLFTQKTPFTENVKPNQKVQWLKPRLVCEVKFTEWTGDENMRHPVYLGLREDKKWNEVTVEK